MGNVPGITTKDLAERAGLAAEVAERLVEEIRNALLAGERVKLYGLGSLKPREADDHPNATTVKFALSRELKTAIREKFYGWHGDRMDDPQWSDEEE